MGHYASEMDSNWDDSCDQSDRLWRLKKALARVPLSNFRAEDAYSLSLLYSVVDFDRVPEDALRRFEKIAGIK